MILLKTSCRLDGMQNVYAQPLLVIHSLTTSQKLLHIFNAYRKATWSESCYVATSNLYPNLKMERWQFSPYTSKRVNGKIKRITRDGALTNTELHHSPDSLVSV